MIIDFTIEDLLLDSYLQKNFHTPIYLYIHNFICAKIRNILGKEAFNVFFFYIQALAKIKYRYGNTIIIFLLYFAN